MFRVSCFVFRALCFVLCVEGARGGAGVSRLRSPRSALICVAAMAAFPTIRADMRCLNFVVDEFCSLVGI